MRRTLALAIAVVTLSVLHAPAPAAAQDVFRAFDDEDFLTDNVEGTFTEMKLQPAERRILVVGDITVHQGDMTLECNALVVWFRTEDMREATEFYVEADGDGWVTVTEGLERVRARQVFFDFTTGQAIILEARLRTVNPDEPQLPYYVRAETVRRLGPAETVAENARFTICPFEHPHVHLSADQVRLTRDVDGEGGAGDGTGGGDGEGAGADPRDGARVSLSDVTGQAGSLPFFYWPFAARSLERPFALESIRYENSNRLGNAILTDWDARDIMKSVLGLVGGDGAILDLDRALGFSSHETLEIDPMDERGVGLGFDVDWSGDDFFGWIDSYYIDDDGDDRRRARQRGFFPLEDSERYRVRAFNRIHLPWAVRADAEVSYISDRNFLEEFFESEAKEDKEQETYLYLRRLEGNRGMTLLTRFRLNDFQSQTEYLPQATWWWIGEDLPFGLTYTSETEFAAARRRLDEDLTAAEIAAFGQVPAQHTLYRFDTRHRLGRPTKLGPVVFEPFGEIRETLYDDSPNDDGVHRFAAAAGGSVSTWFSRTWRDARSELFDFEGLRHVIAPEVLFFNRFEMSRGPEDVFFVDERDTLDFRETVTFNLRQVLEGRDPVTGETFDWISLDLSQDWFLSEHRDNAGEDFGPLRTELYGRITDRISTVVRTEFSYFTDKVDRVDAGVTYYMPERFELHVGSRHREDDFTTAFLDLDMFLTEKYDLAFYYEYDFERDELNDVRVSVRRLMHKFVLEFSVGVDEGLDDTSISVNFAPLGVTGLRKLTGVEPPADAREDTEPFSRFGRRRTEK